MYLNKVPIITPIHNVMYFKKSDLWQSPEAQDFVPRALMPTHNIAPMHNFMPIYNIIPIHYIMYQSNVRYFAIPRSARLRSSRLKMKNS